RRGHVRTAARPRWSTSITGDMPGFHAGRAPGDKGLRYPADPPNVEPGERGTFVRIDAAVVRACDFHDKLGLRLDASSSRRRLPERLEPAGSTAELRH